MGNTPSAVKLELQSKITQDISLIVKTALPLMIAFLAQQGMKLVNTLMMGQIGSAALAAGALGTTIFFTLLVFCMGILSAVGIFIARARGAQQVQEISSNLQQGIYLALLLSLPCMIILWYVPDWLTNSISDVQLIDGIKLLLHGMLWGFPGFLLFLVYREFIAAFFMTRIVMLVALIAIPLTWVSNVIFIYGKYGMPVLGIAGIGYANTIVMWIMFFCLLFYSKKHFSLKKHAVFISKKIELRKLFALFALGLPTGLFLLLDMGLFLSASLMMGYFGVDALAAYQIASQYIAIAYAIPFSLSMTTALLVSHAIGTNAKTRIKRTIIINISFGLIFAGLLALVFGFFPQFLVDLFLQQGQAHFIEISQQAQSFLRIIALLLCFDAVQTIFSGALKGMKDTLVPMLLCVSCYWIIGVGGAYYLTFYTRLGELGIWYGIILGIASVAVILMSRFFIFYKVQKFG